MKIHCPNTDCEQRIAITLEDASTEGMCPTCGRQFTCPPIEDFPSEEHGAVPLPLQAPKRSSNRPLHLEPKAKMPNCPSRWKRLSTFPGGRYLGAGIVLFQIQVVVPMLLICLGLGLQPGDRTVKFTMTAVTIGIAQLLLTVTRKVWQRGWAGNMVIVAIVLEVVLIAMQTLTMMSLIRSAVTPTSSGKYFGLSQDSMMWISGSAMSFAVVALILFVLGLRAAVRIDNGELEDNA